MLRPHEGFGLAGERAAEAEAAAAGQRLGGGQEPVGGVDDAGELPQGRGLHSYRFQLNLSSSVHRVTQLNCVLELLKLSSIVNMNVSWSCSIKLYRERV